MGYNASFSSFLFDVTHGHVVGCLQSRSYRGHVLRDLCRRTVSFSGSAGGAVLTGSLKRRVGRTIGLLDGHRHRIFRLDERRVLAGGRVTRRLGVSVSAMRSRLSTSLGVVHACFGGRNLLRADRVVFFRVLFRFWGGIGMLLTFSKLDMLRVLVGTCRWRWCFWEGFSAMC